MNLGRDPSPQYQSPGLMNFADKHWAFQNIDQVVQCDLISRSNNPAVWDYNLIDIDDYLFREGGNRAATITEILTYLQTDSLVVAKNGVIVMEEYLGGMKPDKAHILFSAGKPFAGVLIANLIADGRIRGENDRITRYIPELENSAFFDATIRNLLDMQTGIDFRDIQDPAELSRSCGFAPPHGDESIERVFSSFHRKLIPAGKATDYQSINTDLISLLVTRLTGSSTSRIIQETIFEPMGAEFDGYLVRDQFGINALSGGLAVSARDLVKFGTMILNDGRYNQKQIIPAGYLNSIEGSAEPDKWRDSWIAQLTPQAKAYRNHLYLCADDFDSGSFFGVGNYGNALYICPSNQSVIALQSTYPTAVDIPRFNTKMDLLNHLAHSV